MPLSPFPLNGRQVNKVEDNAMRYIGNSKYQMGFLKEPKVGNWNEIEFAFNLGSLGVNAAIKYITGEIIAN